MPPQCNVAKLQLFFNSRNLFVHGFVVDEDNKKMSKSLGNVVNPTMITDGDPSAATNLKAFGVDVLRYNYSTGVLAKWNSKI